MTDEMASDVTLTAPETSSAAAEDASEALSSKIVAVGDILAQGTIVGVRRFAAGGGEISFNGIDWIALS